MLLTCYFHQALSFRTRAHPTARGGPHHFPPQSEITSSQEGTMVGSVTESREAERESMVDQWLEGAQDPETDNEVDPAVSSRRRYALGVRAQKL